ncbi:MAG: N-acetylmuramoyl-L-alanine amidase [Crocinitomicaceae bacterium]|nr:N-acetylmuramoyl-L-alanine amidase [Crocinitomicaceae bacterium]
MRLLTLLFFCLFGFLSSAQTAFQTAYSANPHVPSGVLEAVAWTNTHMLHLNQTTQGCSGMPQAYGIMGLHDDGKGYFIENGNLIANLSGISVDEQKNSEAKQIEAYAKSFNELMIDNGLTNKNDPVEISKILGQLSEIPSTGVVNVLARDIQTYSILKFMGSDDKAALYDFSTHHFNLESIFGASNYQVLSSPQIKFTANGIKSKNGVSYLPSESKSTEYGPAIWDPAAICNFSSRSGTAISAITIHTVQGTYAGAISWAQNCASSVSYHYVIRSSDGQVTQMVNEADKAWHVGSENPYTIGYEHEGYVNNPSWYTEEMYNSSADLSRDIVNSGYGILPIRTYYGASSLVPQTLGGCTKIKGHQHFPNATHTDPGINWDWEKYYQLINNAPTINTLTNPTDTFYDTGGVLGDYQDDEREIWLIQPTNVLSITLDFTAFNLETGYDNMFIYDGDSLNDPLIGSYSGTNYPSQIISTGGSLLVEFRSDCGTVSSGWEATYSSVPQNVSPPTTTIITNSQWQTTDFTVDFIDSDTESSIIERFYLISEKSLTENSAHGHGDFGFAKESFNDNDLNWTDVTGSYDIVADAFQFQDTLEQNSNSFMLVDQQSSQSYLYEWSQTITSFAPNQRAGLHFFCDDPTLSNRGNSYFVYLRSNDNKVQIYSVDNNVYTLENDVTFTINEGQEYNCKVWYDPGTGWIKFFIDNDLVGSWQDLSPLTSGNSISLRTGGCNALFDNVHVYKSRPAQVIISVGFSQEMSIESENAIESGFVNSMVIDSTNDISAVDEAAYLIDFSNPQVIFLHDGTGADVDTFLTSTIAANWEIEDIHSDISNFEIAIGTLPNLDDVYPWTSNGIAPTFSTVLNNPIYNQVYHISVRATNGAGLDETYISNGQRYVDDLNLIQSKLEVMILYPNPATDIISFSNGPAAFDLMILDNNGKVCLSERVSGGNPVNINNLAKGKYTAIIKVDNQFIPKQFIKH